MYVRGMLEISSWAVLRTCQDGYQKAGCVKGGECFIGWNGAKYGNNCIGFDQSVQGRLEIVLKIPSQQECEAQRCSNLELRQVQETVSIQMFRKNAQWRCWNISVTVMLLFYQILNRGSCTCFYKRQNICCRWMHLRGQFSKECQIYGSGWVSVISQSRLWQFVTVDGIKSSCLVVVLGSHRDQCRVQYYCAYFFF